MTRKEQADWDTVIRPRILARAGNCCEWPGCGVRNGAEGVRDVDGVFHELGDTQFDLYEYPAGARPFRIILDDIDYGVSKRFWCGHTFFGDLCSPWVFICRALRLQYQYGRLDYRENYKRYGFIVRLGKKMFYARKQRTA
jgi:hypothetical protein